MVESNHCEERLARVEHMVEALQRESAALKVTTRNRDAAVGSMDGASFDRIADLLNALLEHSKHGEELRAEVAAEIEQAHRRASTLKAVTADRRRGKWRRKRQAAA